MKNFSEAVCYIESFSFDFLKERFLSLHPMDEYSYSVLVDGLRDFYLSCFLQQNDDYFSSFPCMMPIHYLLDELWHTHILFTKNYFDFCFCFFGFYLHHTPLSRSDFLSEEDLNVALLELKPFGLFLKTVRNYSVSDLNLVKNHPDFSLIFCLSQILEDVPFSRILK